MREGRLFVKCIDQHHEGRPSLDCLKADCAVDQHNNDRVFGQIRRIAFDLVMNSGVDTLLPSQRTNQPGVAGATSGMGVLPEHQPVVWGTWMMKSVFSPYGL